MTTSKSQARRQAIIDTTIEVLAELGYAQCSFEVIASRLSVSKSVIAYQFKSKDWLLQTIVENVYTAGEAYMTPRIMAAHQDSALAMLRAYIRSNMQFINESHVHIMALLEIMHNWRPTHPGQQKQDLLTDNAITSVALIFSYGQQQSEFRAFDCRAMGIALRASIDAAAAQLWSDVSFDVIQYGEELVGIFEHACCPKE